MNWILEHMQVVILVAGAIAYWVNQRRKAGEDEAEEQRRLAAPPPPRMQTPAGVDDEAERVRRIQEEIRRKILERLGGAVPTPQPPPVPVEELERPVEPPMLRPTMQERAPAKEDAYAMAPADNGEKDLSMDEALLERQRELSEKLRELEEKRRHVAGKAEAFAEQTAVAMSAANRAPRGSLLADLRDPEAARRAIILREVLGTPVGLR